jgi:hypothetical protein
MSQQDGSSRDVELSKVEECESVRGCLIVDLDAHQEHRVLKRILIDTILIGQKEVHVYTAPSRDSTDHPQRIYTYVDPEGKEHIAYDLREIESSDTCHDSQSPLLVPIWKRQSDIDLSLKSYVSGEDTEKLRNVIVKKELLIKRSSDTSVQRRSCTKYPKHALLNPILSRCDSDMNDDMDICNVCSQPRSDSATSNDNLGHRHHPLSAGSTPSTPEGSSPSPTTFDSPKPSRKRVFDVTQSGSADDEMDSVAAWNERNGRIVIPLTPQNSLNQQYWRATHKKGSFELSAKPPKEGSMLNVQPPDALKEEFDTHSTTRSLIFPCNFM